MCMNNNNSTALSATKTDSSSSKPPSKLANFDTELSNLISGLKINLSKDSDPDLIAGTSVNDAEDDEILQVEQSPMSFQTNLVDTETADKEIVEPQPKTENNGNVSEIKTSGKSEAEKLKPLSEMYVDLNSTRPHDKYTSRCILDDPSGLKIMLNFAKDRPRDDISVYVITTTNQNRSSISDYQFDASVSRVKFFVHFLFSFSNLH